MSTFRNSMRRWPPICARRSICFWTTSCGAKPPISASCCWPTRCISTAGWRSSIGADLPADAPFQKVSLEPDRRAGVLSHPYLMAGFAYTATSSPIHRGVFIARSVLGRSLRPPPEAVSPLPPDLHADLTTRERIALQTSPQMCQSCHAMINPLGLHAGELRRRRPLPQPRRRASRSTPAARYRTRIGDEVKFSGVRDLATFLADSEETHSAFVEQLFHYLIKQPIRAYGPEDAAAAAKVVSSRTIFNIRRLVVEIVAAAALTGREVKLESKL